MALVIDATDIFKCAHKWEAEYGHWRCTECDVKVNRLPKSWQNQIVQHPEPPPAAEEQPTE